jgi:hypothetical protein
VTLSAVTPRHQGDLLQQGDGEYIGVDTPNGDLEAALLRKLYTSAGADWRVGFWVATNFTSTAQAIPARAGTRLLLGTRSVPPGRRGGVE